MQKKWKVTVRNNAGFTLVEMIIVLVLMGMMAVAISGLISFSTSTEKTVEGEYEIQSDMRLATELLNNAVRNASATFIMAASLSESDLADNWNYFGISPNGKVVYQYIWDDANGEHVPKVVIPTKSGITYSLTFENKTNTKLVGYKLSMSKENGKNLDIYSTLSAINSVAVDFNATERNPATVIAYRTEERARLASDEQVSVVISMVLDDSGSMNYYTNSNNNAPAGFARKDIMLDKASALIDTFNSNVRLGVVRFSNEGSINFPLTQMTESNKTLAKNSIPTTANGGTNTGDGLRRAYFQLKTYAAATGESPLYYIILLTDGDPTYYSHTRPDLYGDGVREDYSSFNSAYYQITDGSQLNLAGTGNSDQYNNCIDYTAQIGSTWLRTDTRHIKTFVIGFSGISTDVTRAAIIAQNCNPVGTTLSSIYYYASDAASLGSAFNTIKESILKDEDQWYIYGPGGTPED